MLTAFFSFSVSLIITLFIIRYNHLHSKYSSDLYLKGIQKFHAIAVPRIGGVGVLVGVSVPLLVKSYINMENNSLGINLLLCSSFVFLIGFIEDCTKKVTVRVRLIFTVISALSGGVFLNSWIARADFPILDNLIAVQSFSILFTCFAVTGVSNAYNIIDGYNGLAAMVAVIVLSGLSYVSGQTGDIEIYEVCLMMIGSILGFLVWNFPNGLIFLGDGGAYLIGFIIAELSILLIARNNQVSPWCPLLLSFYPIFETIYSIYRKKFLRGMSPGLPDGLHLHMLIYKRAVRWAVGSDSIKDKTIRNALTSPYLWVLTSMTALPSILFWKNSSALIFFLILFISFYLFIYYMIIRYRIPNWAKVHGKSKKGQRTRLS